MMKRFFVAFFIGLTMFVSTQFASAQDVTRVVILPFSAASGIEAYGLGLATALQRSLNVVNNLYAPPVGDAYLYTQKLLAENTLSIQNVVDAFQASVIIAGDISGSANTGVVRLGFSGPKYPQSKDVTLNVSLDSPSQMVAQVADAVLKELALATAPNDLSELSAMTGQIPSAPSLNAVSEAALRLPGVSLSNLETALQLDINSSWVNSEYARALAIAGDTTKALEVSLNALGLQPLDVEALVNRGIILRAANDDANALLAFDAALAINPSHAIALAGKGNIQKDAAMLESALNSYPRLVEAYLSLASLQNQTDPGRAVQTLRLGATRVPESPALHRAIIRSALSSGDTAGAVSYLQQTLAAQSVPSPSLYALVNVLPVEQRDQALAILREGRAKYPDSLELLILEADVLSQSGDNAGAENLLIQANTASPGNSNIVNALAAAQAKQGKLEEAKATFQSVAGSSDAGSNDTVQLNLAQLFLQIGENQSALDTLTPLTQSQANNAEIKALYGVALSRLGRADEANAAFDQALAIDPNQVIAQGARSQQQNESQITGGQAVQLTPESKAALDEGRNALLQQDYPAAINAFRRARAAQDHGLLAFYEALALQQNDNAREALPAYERALQDFPNSDIVLNNYGYAQALTGRYDLAIDTLNKALTANPDNASVFLNLGLVYYNLSRFGDAVTAWEKALSLKPDLQGQFTTLLEDARAKQ
jgi:tetratricopeptide (TPR) repeat protein